MLWWVSVSAICLYPNFVLNVWFNNNNNSNNNNLCVFTWDSLICCVFVIPTFSLPIVLVWLSLSLQIRRRRFHIPGAPKSIPLKNLANFSRTTEIWDTNLHTGYSSDYHKCGKVNYVVYRIDKITLLLVIAT